ncbi:hypothetical protein [Rhizobium leguminosarum]|uniref:hypothetical protein n=1 Tax=Rhizobium leguminosarum TaxID=384 RepID=UPI002E112B6B|nr:hypothetical protein U8Q02_41355 [Rhizobium leguminosarum]
MKSVESLSLPELLKLDVVSEVEKAIGRRVTGEPDLTGILALSISIDAGRRKRNLLAESGDTYMGMQMSAYRTIIESYGFELVLDTPFLGHHAEERHFIYAHCDGLLLSVDSYGGERVNGGKVYYTWQTSPDVKDRHNLTSSGGYIDRGVFTLWQGDHDCREAIIHNLENLRAAGSFVSPWPKPPFLWLLHYMDKEPKNYDYEAITAARIALLPEWVREMICHDDQSEESA